MALRHYTLDFKLSVAVDFASTVPYLLSIFHEEEMTETVHETNGQGYLGTFIGQNGRFAVLRVHSHELVTIDLQCYEEDNIGQLDNLLDALETKLKGILNGKITRIKRLPALVRGAEVDRYWPTNDGRLVEYDMDRLVCDEDSAYQNIKILHSKQYGNILILKGDINLADSDVAYNKAIMNGENFAGKESFTLLIIPLQSVNIDQQVIEMSKKYMRRACGNILDNMEGDCYKIIVSDCVPVLKKFIEEGNTFDYVLNELTAIPMSTEPKEDSAWEFLRNVLDMSIKVLRPSGKYLTTADCVNHTESHRLYEEEMGKLSCPVAFTKKEATVPYFMEQWVMYCLWKK
ncbi:hypothetical protein PBY51_003541 [Eleginops maclovinus]|uniref:PABS domain-containing protein n=1 Tax=Eleginops maclovinus TaxID=56733 RepID=A0AAN8AWL7_ELEMC|nr:hypothetical protein PBY51_003541 [Eleginops maclovinus]